MHGQTVTLPMLLAPERGSWGSAEEWGRPGGLISSCSPATTSCHQGPWLLTENFLLPVVQQGAVFPGAAPPSQVPGYFGGGEGAVQETLDQECGEEILSPSLLWGPDGPSTVFTTGLCSHPSRCVSWPWFGDCDKSDHALEY
jgi:hypothetical protein